MTATTHSEGQQQDDLREFVLFRWDNRLESLMVHFGASSAVDLPALDLDSCESAGQYRRAVRARARYLSQQIAWIQQHASGPGGESLFVDLILRAQLINDGPTWFVIEQRVSPLNASSSK